MRRRSDGDPPTSHDLGTAMLALITSIVGSGALLIVVDDAQWMDATSADLLAFVLRRLPMSNVVAVLARRSATEPVLANRRTDAVASARSGLHQTSRRRCCAQRPVVGSRRPDRRRRGQEIRCTRSKSPVRSGPRLQDLSSRCRFRHHWNSSSPIGSGVSQRRPSKRSQWWRCSLHPSSTCSTGSVCWAISNPLKSPRSWSSSIDRRASHTRSWRQRPMMPSPEPGVSNCTCVSPRSPQVSNDVAILRSAPADLIVPSPASWPKAFRCSLRRVRSPKQPNSHSWRSSSHRTTTPLGGRT